jgi:uncharacterized SAM-binding protein YcdF (DUF218 family)
LKCVSTPALRGPEGVIDTIFLIPFVGVNVGVLFPALIGIILILYAFLKLRFFKDRPIFKNRMIRILITCSVSVFILSFIIVELLLITNTSEQSIRTDYVIVLGAGVRGEHVSETLGKRLNKAAQYIDRYPGVKVIVSGGQGPGEDITEAEAMKRYLISAGIKQDDIIKEDKSTSTMENFRYSKKIISDTLKEKPVSITIVTSDYHMLRAKMLAKRNGLRAYGLSCGTPLSIRVNEYAREYFALFKSLVFDR